MWSIFKVYFLGLGCASGVQHLPCMHRLCIRSPAVPLQWQQKQNKTSLLKKKLPCLGFFIEQTPIGKISTVNLLVCCRTAIQAHSKVKQKSKGSLKKKITRLNRLWRSLFPKAEFKYLVALEQLSSNALPELTPLLPFLYVHISTRSSPQHSKQPL